MKDLKTSIVESLDGTSNAELYPYLNYLLQDLTEIGTDPRLVEKLIRTHIQTRPLKILDLGCGKGAVSIHLAKELGCHVTGIDGLDDFIESATNLAAQCNISHLCYFTQGDIRKEIMNYKGFDIVILGAIGPVFGFMGDTLRAVSPALIPGGHVVIDDGFKDDGTLPDYDRTITRSQFYNQIIRSGFRVVEEIIIPAESLAQSNQDIQQCIVNRAKELITLYPEKEAIFRDYVLAQENEIEMMENQLTVGIWLLKMD